MIRELALFDELADLEEEERRRRLAAIGRDDPALARAVERLFEADRLSSGVLDQATGSIAAASSGATGEPPAPQHPPFAMLGAWRLGALLGVGGMGEVWSGERQEGGFAQRAAIKLVRAGMASRQVVARFLLERQVLARLEHPAIARILDGGLTPDGRPWFAMELVDGVPLLDYVQRERPPLRDRLRLFLRIAEPVELAHRRLVVHRDIKPGNVLVEPGGAPRLLDFGLAKLLEEEAAEGATRTELRALTPAYAAPEQVLGDPVSTATDVYSLGVLLYQLLTGELPHRRSSPSNAGLAREVLHETLERASLRVERRALESGESRAEARAAARPLAGDLDVILARAMQREPERRYPSVAAFALDVERHLAGLPIAARADSLGYRASKFVRRNWFAVAATVAVLLSLVTGLAISIRQTARANAAAETARTEAQRAERVKRFLVSVFEQADPTRTMGAEMPARQILGEGAQRLEHELADEPEVRAELFDTVSRIQSSLGLLDEALASAERSAAERTRLLGAASPATAESLTTVGYAQLAQGRQAEAETTVADALGRFEAAGETSSARYARALSARAQLRMMNGDLSGARSDETRVHELFAAALGPDDSETLEHLSNLAVIETEAGTFAEAARIFRSILATLEKNEPRDSAKVLAVVLNLATALDTAGENAEALPLFERVVAGRRKIYGEGHPALAEALVVTSIRLSRAGRQEEALAALEEARAVYAPIDHPELASVDNYAGLVLVDLGRFAEAERAFGRSVARFSRDLGPDAVMTMVALGNQAAVINEQGRPGEAVRTFDRAIATLREKGEFDNPRLVRMRIGWGAALRRSGRLPEARATVEEALALAREKLGPEHQRVAEAEIELAFIDLAERGPDSVPHARERLARAEEIVRGKPATPSFQRQVAALGAALLKGS